MLVKFRVAETIQRHQDEAYPFDINVKAVAEDAQVSRTYVYTVMAELEEQGELLDPAFKEKH